MALRFPKPHWRWFISITMVVGGFVVPIFLPGKFASSAGALVAVAGLALELGFHLLEIQDKLKVMESEGFRKLTIIESKVSTAIGEVAPEIHRDSALIGTLRALALPSSGLELVRHLYLLCKSSATLNRRYFTTFKADTHEEQRTRVSHRNIEVRA